jgi:polar amino acid transport system substrate-binding protein
MEKSWDLTSTSWTSPPGILGSLRKSSTFDFALIKSGAALNSGKCDLAAAGMTITDERKQNLDFSEPYFDASQALMSRKGLQLASLDDVKAKGLKIGALASTTGRDYVKKMGFDPIEFADSARQLQALRARQIDVLVQDLPVVRTWLRKPEIAAEFVMVTSLNTGEQYGVAIRKGNASLTKTVNEAIESAKKDGTYAAIYKKWFDIEPGSAAP